MRFGATHLISFFPSDRPTQGHFLCTLSRKQTELKVGSATFVSVLPVCNVTAGCINRLNNMAYLRQSQYFNGKVKGGQLFFVGKLQHITFLMEPLCCRRSITLLSNLLFSSKKIPRKRHLSQKTLTSQRSCQLSGLEAMDVAVDVGDSDCNFWHPHMSTS